MRRLTLILSDLYLPAEPDIEFPDTAQLPHFQWLLSLAGNRQILPDWRWYVVSDTGRLDLSRLAPAQVAAHGKFPEGLENNGWLATPVNFEARLDHVRLTPAGLLRLAPEERAAWCTEFARAFGPELSLHDAGPRAFLLMGLPALTAETLDPARLLGGDISKGLPVGPDSNRLRRLGAEIEMWAHGCALNRDREHRRQPVLSGLWLWGGNGFPRAEVRPAATAPSLAFAGEDPCLAGLSRLMTGQDPVAVPEALDAFAPAAQHRIAVFTPMTDAGQSLDLLDTHWFGPASESLKRGELDQLQIYANDRMFYIVNLDRVRFWRRRYRWIDSLRRAPDMPKA